MSQIFVGIAIVPPSSSASTGSPFTFGQPIADRAKLVGRNDTISDIESHLFCESPRCVNLHGAARLGKSSLLHYFATQAATIAQANHLGTWVVTGVSLKDPGCRTVNGFHQRILQDLLGQPVIQGNSSIATEVQRAIATVNQDSAQDGSCIKPVLAALRLAGWRWLICLDDFEDAMDHPEEFGMNFYDGWRSLTQNSPLLLVVASRRDVEIYSREKKITSDFFNVLQKVNLCPLNRQEAEALLSCPGAGLSAADKAAALRWVKQPEGYAPELLQKAGACLWRSRREGKTLDWAHQKFLAQTRSVELPSEPRPGRGKQLVAALLWMPKTAGQLAMWLGAKLDEAGTIATGMIILIAIGGIAIGAWKSPQVQEAINSAIELPNRLLEPSNEK
ncbi:ATP-binding protein [Limnothrix sp. FACHB-708]|uniref:ATP-binding protein n=1 Tax=unclassified Limnothrix TaxID=2632864 RepID=UPI00168207C5|nr:MULTISPECIES: ATP-binding protein [unclassified Limnothrix]MBD2553398.1 ATP-binding protein [Limnothrix sp. FACHB-708]MBD2590438.1 ATP-binding protein [Limnothrix sp. FACHB-406]